MPDFKAALDLVLKYEGGKVDDPRDPGGRTAYGVTQTTFNAYCKSCGATPRDVWTITPAEVEAVYRNRYAAPIRFDDLPNGVGFCTLDGAINSGTHRGAQWLQAALGVQQDGSVGPATIEAARKASAFTTINAMCDARLAFLRGLGTWSTYGRGWSARVEDVRKNATAMAHAATMPVASVPTVTQAKPTPQLDLIRNTIAAKASEAGVIPKPASVPIVAPATPSPGPLAATYSPPTVTQHGPKPLQPETWLQRVGVWFGRKAGA